MFGASFFQSREYWIEIGIAWLEDFLKEREKFGNFLELLVIDLVVGAQEELGIMG